MYADQVVFTMLVPGLVAMGVVFSGGLLIGAKLMQTRNERGLLYLLDHLREISGGTITVDSLSAELRGKIKEENRIQLDRDQEALMKDQATYLEKWNREHRQDRIHAGAI